MPELAWEDDAKDPPSPVPAVLESTTPSPPKNKLDDHKVFPTLGEAAAMDKKQVEANLGALFVPVPVAYTQTMTPHCSTPGCKRCAYKMKCFQTWASSMTAAPVEPEYRLAMSLPAHMTLNL